MAHSYNRDGSIDRNGAVKGVYCEGGEWLFDPEFEGIVHVEILGPFPTEQQAIEAAHSATNVQAAA